jgi:hypothetical protein
MSTKITTLDATTHRQLTVVLQEGRIENHAGSNVQPVDNGFVVVYGKIRTFFPMSRVIRYTYIVDDYDSRRLIEGLQG